MFIFGVCFYLVFVFWSRVEIVNETLTE